MVLQKDIPGTVTTLVSGNIKATFAAGAVPISVNLLLTSNAALRIEAIDTVLEVSWYRATRVLWIQFNSKEIAQRACDAIDGANFEVSGFRGWLKPSRNGKTWSVQVSNLAEDVKDQDLLEILPPDVRPIGFKSSEPIYDWDTPALEIVEEHVESSSGRKIKSKRPLKCANPLKDHFEFRFEGFPRLDGVARQLDGKRERKFGGSTIYARERVEVRLSIRREVFRRHSLQLNFAWYNLWRRHEVQLDIDEGTAVSGVNAESGAATESGASAENGASAKSRGPAESERSAGSGATADSGGSAKSGGYDSGDEDVRVRLQTYNRKGLVAAKATLDRILAREICGSGPRQSKPPAQTHRIRLTKTKAYRDVVNGGFQRALDAVGPTVIKLDDETEPPAVVVRGDTPTLRKVQQCLRSNGWIPEAEPATCEVCFDDADEFVRIEQCGHSVCKQCFVRYCTMEGTAKFPLRCFESGCDTLMSMQQLRSKLEKNQFEQLLTVAVTDHFSRKPAEYAPCVGADCPSFFRTSSTERQHICPICFTPTCRDCKVEFHFGETCRQYQSRTSENLEALEKWIETEGAKHCKNCNALIQKEVGCDNMQCHFCKAHFCWYCLKVCPTHQGVYAHLMKEHGGFIADPQERADEMGHIMADEEDGGMLAAFHGHFQQVENELREEMEAAVRPLRAQPQFGQRIADFVRDFLPRHLQERARGRLIEVNARERNGNQMANRDREVGW